MFQKKITRLVAVGVMALFLGATWARAQVPPPPVIIDTDGDGVPDDVDECPGSDTSLTVFINGVDTGIHNTDNPTGCTLADLIQDKIEECLDDAKNHGQFVSCVSHYTNTLKRARIISGNQKGKIQSIVAKMK
jgi:hypothetical protein